MTQKDNVGVSAGTLVAGWFAALLCVVVASLVPETSALQNIAVAGSVVFGCLVASGTAWFFAVMVRAVSTHHHRHQDLLFVSRHDHIIDRSSTETAPLIGRPVQTYTLEVADLSAFPHEVQQAFGNGGHAHDS